MNNITISWCPEDRARIDKLITLLEDLPKHDCSKCVDAAAKYATRLATEVQPVVAPVAGASLELVTPVEPLAPAEPSAPVEEPAHVEEPAAPAENVPDRGIIQRRVVELSAAGKKEEVKAIVTKHAPKVSDIPEDKLGEVWTALCALEG